ncbi:hypothetical protein ABTN41_19240, partial [Acinetobacter baumannii]
MLNFNHRGEALEHSLRLIQPRLIVVGSECWEALQETSYAAATQHVDVPLLWDGEGDVPDRRVRALRAELSTHDDANPPETGTVTARG